LKLLFLHGLESNPSGTKAVWLRERYGAIVPALDTSTWEKARAQAEAAVREHQPDVLVGSSFGGALAVSLLCDGVTSARTVLIAQAAALLGKGERLPAGTRAIVIHGTADDVVPIEGSRTLVGNSGPNVHLWEIESGDHRLNSTLEDGTLARAIEAVLALP
jgi:predicted esterase